MFRTISTCFLVKRAYLEPGTNQSGFFLTVILKIIAVLREEKWKWRENQQTKVVETLIPDKRLFD